SPWLDATEPVPPVHLIRAADATGRSIREVAARLVTLGHTIGGGNDTVVAITIGHLDTDDLILTSRDLDGMAPWLTGAEPVPLAQLLLAAMRTRRGLSEVAARLATFGYRWDADLGRLDVGLFDAEDLILASNDLDGSPPWLKTSETVSVLHVVNAASKGR